MFKYFLYRLGLFILKWLPIKVSYKIASAISDVQWFFSFRDRKAVVNNLRQLLPEDSNISFHAREVFRNFGKYLVEFFQMNEMIDNQFIENHVQVSGIENLDHVLTEGKGGIVVTAHIGNWEMGAVLLNMLGYPLQAVALPHKERPVNDLFNQRRAQKGVTVIPTNTALRRCVEQLKKNKFVGLVVDRDFTTNGIVMDFLGSRAFIPKGAAMFAWKTGAPICPVFLIRREDDKFQLSCHAPIYPPQKHVKADEQKVIKDIVRQYISVIEDQIRKYPSQWMLFREFSTQ